MTQNTRRRRIDRDMVRISPLLAAGGGVYCEDCNIAQAVPADDPSFTGVRPRAIDPEAAKRLWSLSEKMLAESFAI
jgi:hypothetical protein